MNRSTSHARSAEHPDTTATHHETDTNHAANNAQTPRFFVFGEARRPGVYRYKYDLRVLAVLVQVQPTRYADISRIRLLQPTPRGRMRLVETINLHRLLNHGDQPDNRRIRPGQVLYLPPTGIARITLAWRQLLGLGG